jgi:hypothetical protein
MKKLTLSVDEQVIRQAKRLAKEHRTSVSAMFGRFVNSLADEASPERRPPAGPIARRASGVIRLPKQLSEREVLESALLDKYGNPR